MLTGSTLVAIVRDERAYLIEWVAYHRLMGFDRLILYSNDCSDGTDVLLDRMAEAGLVEHRPWLSFAGRSAQQAAYADAVGRCATEWIMFLDADEFLHLEQDDRVAAFVARFPTDVAAVAICWRVFGSSGQLWQGPQPVVQRFTNAAPVGHHLNRHIKTIARAAAIDAPNVHGVTLRHGTYALPDGEPYTLHRGAFAWPRYDVAQVNHYVVRSRAEFAQKLARGNANLPPESALKQASRGPGFFEDHDRNEEVDRSILRRLPALKREMAWIVDLL